MCLLPEEFKAVSRNSRAILDFIDPSEDKLLASISANWTCIKHIPKPTKAIREHAIVCDERSIKYLIQPTIEEIRLCVANHPRSIRFFDQPEDLQLIALNSCKTSNERHLVVGYIKNPSYELSLRCVKSYGLNLGKIKKHTDELIEAAIKNNPSAIQFVKKPKPEWQLLVVSKNPQAIKHIEDPTEEARLLAVKTDCMSIRWIKKTTLEEQKLCIFSDETCTKLRYDNASTMTELFRNLARPTAKMIDIVYDYALGLKDDSALVKILMKWCAQYTRKKTVKVYIKMKYNF